MHTQVSTTPIQNHVVHCEPRPTLDQQRADLLLSGYTVDDETLEFAQLFIAGEIDWKTFLLHSSYDHLPAEVWDEWTR